MQPPKSSFQNTVGLPKFGKALNQLRRWEAAFREASVRHGFTELSLPLLAPLQHFRSRLTGDNMLPQAPVFTDPSGVQWALRSDMTAFAVQFLLEHAFEIQFPVKLSYAGKVFGLNNTLGAAGIVPGGASSAKFSRHGAALNSAANDSAIESWEFGAEIVGRPEIGADLELVQLAADIARDFGLKNLVLTVGDARFARSLLALLEKAQEGEFSQKELLPELSAELIASLIEDVTLAFSRGDRCYFEDLFNITSTKVGNQHLPLEWKTALKQNFDNNLANSPVQNFIVEVQKLAKNFNHNIEVIFDPFARRTLGFYSGLTFEFFIRDNVNKLRWLGGGGRYDNYFKHFGKDYPAVGFMMKDPSAVIERETLVQSQTNKIRIALPKGRLLPLTLKAFSQVGIEPEICPSQTRKLVIPSLCGRYEFLLVKNSDVSSYIKYETAEIAIVGSDTLDEKLADEMRPYTFDFGSCRICLAGKPEREDFFALKRRPRVATKYEKLASQALRARGLSFDLVPLQGSVELASVIDFADAIVDLVETGTTLRENGLVVFAELGLTKVHLATTQGFFYGHGELIKTWISLWNNSKSHQINK